MKELIQLRSDHDLADFSRHKGIDTIFWRATSQYQNKKSWLKPLKQAQNFTKNSF